MGLKHEEMSHVCLRSGWSEARQMGGQLDFSRQPSPKRTRSSLWESSLGCHPLAQQTDDRQMFSRGKSSFHSNCELELGIALETLQGHIDLI